MVEKKDETQKPDTQKNGTSKTPSSYTMNEVFKLPMISLPFPKKENILLAPLSMD